MKVSISLISFIILMSVFSMYALAYEIRIWPDEVKIESIYDVNIIQANGGLESKIIMFFNLPENFTYQKDKVIIYFSPWEHIDNEPIENLIVSICDDPGTWGLGYDVGYSGVCNKSYSALTEKSGIRRDYFIYQGEISPRNYSDYTITFSPDRLDEWHSYVLLINYTMPHFVFKQGDYYVAWLRYPNMKDKDIKIENRLVLPTKDDIPRFIPDDANISRVVYNESGKLFPKWTFVFNGADDRIIWYINDKEIKENEENLQSKYTWLGLRIGLILSVLLLFIERLVFEWSPYGNRINRWITNKLNSAYVIGNTVGKKYHKVGCVYIDNIDKVNKKPFKNKNDAVSEGYTPCGTCNPDKE